MSETVIQKKEFSTLEIVFGIAAVIGAISIIANLMSKDEAEQQHDDTEAAAAAARKKLYKEIPPSYADYVYRDYADVLDDALLKEATEDEDAVYDIFRDCKNISDVQKIIDTFGHRRELFSTRYISLPQAMKKLSKGEKAKLNGILAAKKINYSFK